MSKKSRKKQLSEKVANTKRRLEKTIEKKPNPFELKFNKQKHAVVGQKPRKGAAAVGAPLTSRHRAFEQRKRTLLPEYQRFGRANEMVDRRLGERNVNLSADQKMALRFAAERRRRYGGGGKESTIDDKSDPRRPAGASNFQLTGVDSILTHRGKALTDIEKLNERPMLDEDEEDEQGFSADFVKTAHFGGGGGRNGEEQSMGIDGERRSRKDLIEEMIANSKRTRYEMQNQREKALEMTEDLDDQWKAAVNSHMVSKWIRTEKDKDDELELKKQQPPPAPEKLDYDRLVHEMILEPRAARAVEKLQKKSGEDSTNKNDEDEDGGPDESQDKQPIGKKSIPKTHITGDDDIHDFQRFKKDQEKPFVVQYDMQGRLMNADVLENDAESAESAVKKKTTKKSTPGIEFLEPRIETNFNPERKKKPPKSSTNGGKNETLERKILTQKYKKELRGTIRELRKDNEFLARQQLSEQQRADTERKRKVKNLMRSLVSQETECNKWKKKKK